MAPSHSEEDRRSSEEPRSGVRRIAGAEDLAQSDSWACDLASRSLSWSPETLRILGLHPDTAPVLLEDCLRLLHSADRKKVDRLGREAVRTGKPVETRLRFCPPDGTERLVSVEGQVLRDSADVPTRASGTVREAEHGEARVGSEVRRRAGLLRLQSGVLRGIAGRRQLQESLSELCLMVEYMFEETACSVLLLETDTGCLRVAAAPNLAHELISSFDGLRPGELARWCGTAAFSREEAAGSEVTAGSTGSSCRNVARHLGIATCWSTPILAADETMVGILLVTHFVPSKADEYDRLFLETSSHVASIAIRRQRGEEELTKSEERYLRMFDHAAVAMWEVDLSHMQAAIEDVKGQGVEDFRSYLEAHPEFVEQAAGLLWVVDVNRATTAMYAVGSVEELRQAMGRILVPESQAGLGELIVAIAEGRSKVEVETVHRSLAGERIDVLMKLGFPWETPMLGRAMMSLIDITERKRAEHDRERLIRELENRNAELERFTYTVSHDLKSPLFTITGFLGMLQKDASEGNTRRVESDIERIRSAAETMSRLLDELLELSRAGRFPKPTEAVAMAELVHEAMDILRERIAERGAEVDISTQLPIVLCDRIWLAKVLTNLIDNSVKYMGSQSAPRIEIGTLPSEEENVCFVRDNGLGVDPRHHEKIFGLFERVEQEPEGTGIGLAICKRIVEAHGGRLWIESEGRGRGSTFFFSLSKRADVS